MIINFKNNVTYILILGLIVIILISGPNETVADAAYGLIQFGYGYGGGYPSQICIKHRNITIGIDGSASGINGLKYRTGSYAFTGENIEFTVVVRNYNGAIDVGFTKIFVDNSPKVLCNEMPLSAIPGYSCDGFGSLNPSTDKAYHCLLTVGPWYGEKEVKITTYNSAFQPTEGTHVETWYFNPELRLQISTSDGQPIRFEKMPYKAITPEERTVHSLNRLVVKNNAAGGVNMWMYIAGTDFYDPSGASKCPTSNVLTIDNMAYRGWTGTQWSSWEGWVEMSKYDENAVCNQITLSSYIKPPKDDPNDPNFHPDADTNMKCYGGLPVPYDPNAVVPQLSHVLTNQGKLEVEFKLTYPMPCVGSFTNGSIMVFGKVV